MKKTLSFITAFLFIALSTGLMMSCKRKFSDDDNSLEVYAGTFGYGIEWLEPALKAFGEKSEIKDKYPNYKYHIVPSNSEFSYANDQIKSGRTSIDLFFGSNPMADMIEAQYKPGQSFLANITDVFESKISDYTGGYEKSPDGEEWTYAEKMKQFNESLYNSTVFVNKEGQNEHFYSVYNSSKYGILYNKTEFDKYGITKLPNTTDELVQLAKDITQMTGENNEKLIPFVFSANTGYWTHIQNLFWGQYEGVEAYDNFFKGLLINDDGDYEMSVDVLKQQGRREAKRVIQQLLDYSNTPRLIHPESAALDFTRAQGYLLLGKGLMQANGDWFDNEMKSTASQAGGGATITFMPDPIISAIRNKTPTIATDAELSALIDAIKAGSPALKGTGYDVSQTDYNTIKEATSIYNAGHMTGPVAIPSYSNAVGLAKDFMLYLASDEVLDNFMRVTSGGAMPFYYDIETKNPSLYNSFSQMQKDRINQIKNKTSLTYYKSSAYPLIYRGNFSSIAEGNEYEFAATYAADRKTADRIIDDEIEQWTKNNNQRWHMLLQNSGY